MKEKLVITTVHLCRNPWWLSGKESACNAGDVGSIPESGKYTGEANDNLLQYSCLGNSMDRGGWQAIVNGVAKVGVHLAIKQPPLHMYVHT